MPNVSPAPQPIDHPPWSPNTWQTRAVPCATRYPKPGGSHRDTPTRALADALNHLQSVAPLCQPDDLAALSDRLGACQGHASLLHVGRCAETFSDLQPTNVTTQAAFLGRLQDEISAVRGQPPLLLARMAGQCFKPRTRSCVRLTDEATTLAPNFRGVGINDPQPTPEARRIDPLRLSATEAAVRTAWEALGPLGWGQQQRWLSHEALHLPYLAALTRQDTNGGWWYGHSHLLWLGARTAWPNGAHAEFVRGVANPLALKVAPWHTPKDVLQLLQTLNPQGQHGRCTLVYRFSASTCTSHLNALLRVIAPKRPDVLWCCDPMHGNTQRDRFGKFRTQADVEATLDQALACHQAQGVPMHGLHLETAFDVDNECLADPPSSTTERTRPLLCDPQLDPAQALALCRRWAEAHT